MRLRRHVLAMASFTLAGAGALMGTSAVAQNDSQRPEIVRPGEQQSETQRPQPSRPERGEALRRGEGQEMSPRNLLHSLKEANQAEIAAADLAMQRAESREVRELATRIHRDHQRLNQQIDRVAKAQNIELTEVPKNPANLALQHARQKRMERLQELQGAQFDAAFVAGLPMEHDYLLGLVQAGREAGVQAGQLPQILDETERHATHHLEQVEQLVKNAVAKAEERQKG